jgi:hypothetical protein
MRGGNTTDIRIHDITLTGVGVPISMTMDWNPNYSNTSLPAGTDPKTVPDYLIKLTTPVPPEQGLPHFSNVHIWNIKATGAAGLLRLRLPERPANQLQVRPPGHPGRQRRFHRQRPGLDILRHQADDDRRQHGQSHGLHQRHRPGN